MNSKLMALLGQEPVGHDALPPRSNPPELRHLGVIFDRGREAEAAEVMRKQGWAPGVAYAFLSPTDVRWTVQP